MENGELKYTNEEDVFTLKELKVAVINEDFEKLQKISKKVPFFSSIEEAKEINFYINQAINLLQNKKNKISKEMQKIKKLQKFNQMQKN